MSNLDETKATIKTLVRDKFAQVMNPLVEESKKGFVKDKEEKEDETSDEVDDKKKVDEDEDEKVDDKKKVDEDEDEDEDDDDDDDDEEEVDSDGSRKTVEESLLVNVHDPKTKKQTTFKVKNMREVTALAKQGKYDYFIVTRSNGDETDYTVSKNGKLVEM